MIGYETLHKVNAIDGFESYLPHGCVEKDFVEPLVKGGNEEEILDNISEYVYQGLLKNKERLKTFGIISKAKYYTSGEYRLDHKQREFMLLDLDGKDADITPAAIKERLRKFKHIRLEYDIVDELTALGVRCKRATKEMDKRLKADILIELNGEFYGVSVFKSDIQTALYKMRFTKPTLDKRLYFKVKSQELQKNEVKNWLECVAANGNRLFFNTKINAWEAK